MFLGKYMPETVYKCKMLTFVALVDKYRWRKLKLERERKQTHTLVDSLFKKTKSRRKNNTSI